MRGCRVVRVFRLQEQRAGVWARRGAPYLRYDHTEYLLGPGASRLTREECQTEMFLRPGSDAPA
jgi:hypothetical protein